MKYINIITKILDKYDMPYLVHNTSNKPYIVINAELPRAFFTMVESRIKELEVWYIIEPYSTDRLKMMIIKNL